MDNSSNDTGRKQSCFWCRTGIAQWNDCECRRVNYLTDPQGRAVFRLVYRCRENWYYFNESDKAMKTGWHHDSEDGYWYYLNPADGKMMDGWQTIDGKEYFFQPVRNMGNYYFGNEEEKWRYALNGNIPLWSDVYKYYYAGWFSCG